MFVCRFDKLDLNKNGFLEREDLLSLPELSVNPLGDRIIHAFFSENQTVRDTQKLQFQAAQDTLMLPIINQVDNMDLISRTLSTCWPTSDQFPINRGG